MGPTGFVLAGAAAVVILALPTARGETETIRGTACQQQDGTWAVI